MQGPYEKKLLHHLLDKYNVLERPVSNESDPIQISFGITLMQIIDVVIIFPTFLLRFLVE
jgi:nicotinic acetylcholine receptor